MSKEFYDVKCQVCGDYRVTGIVIANAYEDPFTIYLCKCGHEWDGVLTEMEKIAQNTRGEHLIWG